MAAGIMQSQPPTAYNVPAAYATPPVATLTSHGSPGAYSAFHRQPALLTRFTPPAQVSTCFHAFHSPPPADAPASPGAAG